MIAPALFRKIVITVVCSSFIVAACLAAPAHAAGSGPGRPMRIVSLSPPITESLYLLGLKNNIVGVTIYCDRPAEARTKPVMGTVIEPDIEKIVQLRPDLVLAMSLTNPKVLTKMRSLGLKVLTHEIPDTFSGICDMFVWIGNATGTSLEARRIVDTARSEVDAIRKKTARFKKPRVLIELGTKPFFVATRDFFVNDYLEFAGAVNIFQDASSGSVGREEAIVRNPDVILIVTMGLSGDNERRVWKRYSSVNAVRNGRIYIVDSNNVCSPTPLSFARSLKRITGLLHPDDAGGWK
ncbi:MAG: helical backbone metal receptor [Syntrophorhabdaceae bacterium]|nr:helical backbone metal receptor [Syntrophorhabdaceae bacterium]HOC45665.1 helical backbone metal receptor [Syntrophorhabdaceae bacterium]